MRPTKEPFPSLRDSGTTSFGLPKIGTNAYSGATATDFHRVPFSAIRYYISKEQIQNIMGKNKCNRKNYFSRKITIISIAIAKVQIPKETTKTHIKRLCCVFNIYFRYLSLARKVLFRWFML